ncbi:MAG: hypothetical protein R3F39_20115 [Myxococcota bacterium]
MNRQLPPVLFAAGCLLFALAACGGDDGDSSGADTGVVADTSGGDTTGTPDTGAGDTSADAGPDTVAVACNPISDQGCTEGQTCSYNPDSTTPLCVVKGVLPATAGCGGGLGSCDHGICLNLNDTGNLCYEFCKIDDHCQANSECLALTDSTYKVCKIAGIYKTCELLADATCGAGKGCYSTSDEPDPICLPVGAAGNGESCGNVANGCAAGLACVNTACTRLCDKSAAKPCGDEFTQCSNYLDASSNIGICVK